MINMVEEGELAPDFVNIGTVQKNFHSNPVIIIIVYIIILNARINCLIYIESNNVILKFKFP